MTDTQLYLASASPRRGELLEQIGIPFERIAAECDESIQAGESAEQYVARLALDKAAAGLANLGRRPPRPVLGADTAVVVDDEIFGKPRDAAHAMEMLSKLSGRRHQVWSAVALRHGAQEAVKVQVSHVSMRDISAQEIQRYWASGEPRDKAGAYAVQGMAAIFIQHIEGSYSGIMGLPLFETAQLLEDFGVRILP